MRNIQLILGYDGTSYQGFQDQGKGTKARTIQAELEKAITTLTGEKRRITGAGRTDAGVHAVGQSVNFYTQAAIPLERWPYAMNAVLPPDIVVYEARERDPDFHARYMAIEKTYCYYVDNASFPSILWQRYAYHLPYPLDVALMQQAAEILTGDHDFTSFMGAGSSIKNPIRRITSFTVERELVPGGEAEGLVTGGLVKFTVKANGFLRHMVRNMVGTLLEVGRHRQPVAWVAEVLATKDRRVAGITAPARGLWLYAVRYDR